MSKEKALVIVEEKSTRNAIKILLELSGIDVITRDNAAIALKKNINESFDIILCDLTAALPNGHNIINEIKESPKHYKIPIIVLSASEDEKDYRQARNMGADDFIPIPFSGKLLSNTVKARLDLSKKFNKLYKNEVSEQVFALLNKNFNQELLTPLNGILNATSLIGNLEGIEDIDSLTQLLNVIYASGFRMQRTTQNIRTYSLLNTENTTEVFKISNNLILKDILTSVISHYENGLSPELKLLEVTTLQVGAWEGIEDYARSIFTELIDNAIKFSPPGYLPVVSLQALNNSFVFTVTSFLAESTYFNISTIGPFKKFHQDLSRNGLGLGLFIVKSICEKTGYNFFISKTGTYLTFTVEAVAPTIYKS